MTLIFTPTLFSSRLYDVMANGQRLQTLMFCQMITGRFTFLDVGLWQRNLVDFSAICSEHRSISVGAKKKNVSKFSTQLYKCITIFQSSHSFKVFPVFPVCLIWRRDVWYWLDPAIRTHPPSLTTHTKMLQNVSFYPKCVFVGFQWPRQSCLYGCVRKNSSVLRSVSKAQNAYNSFYFDTLATGKVEHG